jgi:hypothetical protein
VNPVAAPPGASIAGQARTERSPAKPAPGDRRAGDDGGKTSEIHN